MPLLNVNKNGASVKPKKKKTLQKELEIREKLSGKNYSPIVAKGLKKLIEKKKSNSKKVAAKKKDIKHELPKVEESSQDTEKKINPLKRTFQDKKEISDEAAKKKKVSFKVDKIPNQSKEDAVDVIKPTLKNKKSGKADSPTGNLVLIKKVNKSTNKDDSLLENRPVAKKGKKLVKNVKEQIAKSKFSVSLVTKKKVKTEESQKAFKETEKALSTTEEPTVVKPKKGSKSSEKSIEGANTETETANDQEIEVKSEDLSSKKSKGKKTKKNILKPISNIKSLSKKPQAKSLQKKKRVSHSGVCIFKNIPHGFYEKELKSYCSQFGKVTGVYHPVSKNGNSRGYAFVRFAHREVAEVVAETMNNYVMFYRRIRCEMVPKEKEKPGMFNVAKTNEELAREKREAGLKQRMRQLSRKEINAWEKRKRHRVSALHKKLSALGVDYEFKVNESSKKPNEKPQKTNKVT